MFKWEINWKKHQSKVTVQAPTLYLDYLIDLSFLGIKMLFVILFENTTHRTVHAKYYLPTVEIKGYNVMIDGKKILINQ